MQSLESESLILNLNPAQLVEAALSHQEGVLASNGALCVETGARTGRSPKDRFVVQDDTTSETVDWGAINQPMSPENFAILWHKAEQHMSSRTCYEADLSVGADPDYTLSVRVKTELAWHCLFAHHLFIDQPNTSHYDNQWSILNAATLKLDPQQDPSHSDAAVVLNFSTRQVLIIGTEYAGEMKKAMFSVLNYLLPASEVLPMHCAANVGADNHTTLFFGLSGTGKTTLSSDPNRALMGDDEHGWHPDGVFNFEGGCYAKCIDLSEKNEPVIWHAIRDSAIMENVFLDPESKMPDFGDTRHTQNTRAAYPRSHIISRVQDNRVNVQPQALVFLTCDLYGVLPPIACLDEHQAAYYYLNGYTALMGSTEVGSTQSIKTTFSTGFGAAFLPRAPQTYADLLIQRLRASSARVYLVNTGWHKGGLLTGGERFTIPVTRQIIDAINDNQLIDIPTTHCPGFNLAIPTHLPGIDPLVLNPINSWQDRQQYQQSANELIAQFHENFKKFNLTGPIAEAGPQPLVAESL